MKDTRMELDGRYWESLGCDAVSLGIFNLRILFSSQNSGFCQVSYRVNGLEWQFS